MKKKDKISRVLKTVAFTALAMQIFNKMAFMTATAGKKLTEGRQSYYSWKFGSIYYSKCGKGRPVLLVHNLSCDGSDHEWNSIRRLLSSKHTVYTIDLPGCGRSDKKKMLYTNYLYTAAISDFIRKVIGKKTDIITSGISSSIAVMACHAQPELFGRLVLINPEPFDHMVRKTGLSDRIVSRIMLLPVIGTTCYAISNLRSVIAARLRTEYYTNPAKVTKNDIDCFNEAAHLGGPDARFACASMIGHYTDVNSVEALKHIENRIYVISGEDVPDSRYNMEGYLYFCKDASGCMVQGSGMPHMEYPDETARKIEQYLDDH